MQHEAEQIIAEPQEIPQRQSGQSVVWANLEY